MKVDWESVKDSLYVATAIFGATIVLVGLFGCTLIPTTPESIMDSSKQHGCVVKSVETRDNFSWKFLGFSSDRNTNVTCN